MARHKSKKTKVLGIAAVSGWYQQGAAIIGSIISLPFIVKNIGIGNAGAWFTLLSVLSLFQLIDFGFSSAISRQVAHTFNEKKGAGHIDSSLIKEKSGWSGVSDIYGLSTYLIIKIRWILLALTIIAFWANESLHGLFPGDIAANEGVVIMSITIYFTIASKFQQAFIDGLGKMQYTRLINGTQQLLMGVLSIVIVEEGFGLLGLLYLNGFLSIGLYYISNQSLRRISRKKLNISIRAFEIDNKEWGKIYTSSIAFGTMSAGTIMVGAAQIPMITMLLGKEVAAIIYIILKLLTVFSSFVLQYCNVQLPIFTKYCAGGEWENAEATMRSTIIVGSSLFIVLGVVFPYLAPYVLKIWIGPEAELNNATLILLSLNFLVAGPLAIMGQFVTASGANVFVYSTLFHGLISIFGVYLLGERYGAVAIPMSALIGLALTNLWNNPIRLLNLSKQIKEKYQTN